MKGPIPGEKIEEIKNRADIVDVVSEYVTLRKGGRNFLGLCPFHSEKTPSFTVNREKQIFYCFGCGEGGNVITFVMKMAHLTFPEALRHLARKTGVVIPERALTREQKEQLTVREQINRLNNMAAEYFSRNLSSPAGRHARTYLESRGIQNSASREFGLGFALDGWRHLRDYLEQRKVSMTLAEEAGLVIPKADGDGGWYDRFRGRLIFPIEDVSGHVIAFGGRVIGEGDPKYMNSPESPVYSKGRNLYGLSRTREEIRKRGYAILVEGYFDLIALWNAGITNVVATLGTALTRDQVDLLRRYTDTIVALFDPDEAGRKALERSLELFLSANIHGKAVILPAGYDPDSFVRAFGKERMENLIADAPSLVDYYIENIIGGRGTLEEDRHTLSKAVSFITRIDEIIERNLFIKRVSEALGIDQDLLKREVHRAAKPAARTPEASPKGEEKGEIDAVALSLIHLLLQYPDRIPAAAEAKVIDYITDNEIRELGKALLESHESNGAVGLRASEFIDRIENALLRKKLLKLIVAESPPAIEMVDRIMTDTIRQLKRKWYKRQHAAIKKELITAQRKGDGTL